MLNLPPGRLFNPVFIVKHKDRNLFLIYFHKLCIGRKHFFTIADTISDF